MPDPLVDDEGVICLAMYKQIVALIEDGQDRDESKRQVVARAKQELEQWRKVRVPQPWDNPGDDLTF